MATELKGKCGKRAAKRPGLRRSGGRLSPVGHWLRQAVEEVELNQCERAAGRADVPKVRSQEEFLGGFSRGTAAAMREADRLEESLRTGKVTREQLVRSGRAFATVDDWQEAMA